MMRPRALEALPWPRLPFALVFVGAAIIGVGLQTAPERTWLNLVVGGFYLLSLAASAMFFISSQVLSGARWSTSLRIVPDALVLLLPVAAVLMLALVFGRRAVYGDIAIDVGHELAGRARYLQPILVISRLVATLAVWGVLAWRLRSQKKLARYAAIFVVVYAPTFTALSYDWLLCLEPRWFSTMFAVYAFAGAFVQGLAAITLVVVLLGKEGRLDVGRSQLHDLGKLLFAFSTFWAYIWLCQYLLIWYGDIPEEVTYYVRRTGGRWLYAFALDVVVNWLVPFVALMSARAKQNPSVLCAVSVLLLAGHWLDLYVMVMPSRWPAPRVGVLELAVPTFLAALSYVVLHRHA
jgi:hypothetical protein